MISLKQKVQHNATALKPWLLFRQALKISLYVISSSMDRLGAEKFGHLGFLIRKAKRHKTVDYNKLWQCILYVFLSAAISSAAPATSAADLVRHDYPGCQLQCNLKRRFSPPPME